MKIQFTLTDLIEKAKKNIELPQQILSLAAEQNKIKVVLSINKIMPSVTVTLEFMSFDNGFLILQVDAGMFLNLLLPFVSKLPVVQKGLITLSGKYIRIAANELIKEKVNDVEIISVSQTGDEFEVSLR